MQIRIRPALLAAGASLLLAAPPPWSSQAIAQQRQQVTGPIARYDMRAGTLSGQQPGSRPSMASMFGGGGGAGSNIQHELNLRLGSSQAPQGSPEAKHFMPEGMNLGRSVDLATPRQQHAVPGGTEGFPQGRRPTGRMLIYWGCAEHAPPGQPVIIDFSKLAEGQVPPGLWTSTILRDWGPTEENSRSFGIWPSEDGKYVRPDSSLPGHHAVEGNYSPPIEFTLAHDFMAPLDTSLAPLPSGAKTLSWNLVNDATGYYATMFGGTMGPDGQMGDMVMWSSSASRQFGGGLTDWLSPGQVARLVREGVALSPATNSCAIPAEAIRDAGQFRTGTLTAFGPEENFAYPPRPDDWHIPWNISWTARIRHRSSTHWMDIPGMNGAYGRYNRQRPPQQDQQQGQSQGQQQQDQQQCHHSRGLGGMLGGFGGLGGVLGGGGNGC